MKPREMNVELVALMGYKKTVLHKNNNLEI